MRYLSLFSGIEAASVAWEPLGWEPVAFCEIDAFPSAVLAYRYPNVPNLGDITKVDWNEFKERHGAVDIIVGGSPCQSFSIAGGREGLDGESRLMYEYIRAVRELRPPWFLWENVPGVFSTDAGRAFGILLDEMDGLGYGLSWRVLDAQFFGVAQRRRRVFLVGHLGDMRAAAVLFEPDSVCGNTKPSREKREELARTARERVAFGFKHSAASSAGNIGYELEQSPMLIAGKEPAVLSLQTDHMGQNGTNVSVNVCKTLDCASAPPVVCMSNDASNAAIDSDMAGTLLSGGGSPPLIAAVQSWQGTTRESATSMSKRGS